MSFEILLFAGAQQGVLLVHKAPLGVHIPVWWALRAGPQDTGGGDLPPAGEVRPRDDESRRPGLGPDRLLGVPLVPCLLRAWAKLEGLGQIYGEATHSAGKESACNEGDLDSIPGLGRCPAEGNSYFPGCLCVPHSKPSLRDARWPDT